MSHVRRTASPRSGAAAQRLRPIGFMSRITPLLNERTLLRSHFLLSHVSDCPDEKMDEPFGRRQRYDPPQLSATKRASPIATSNLVAGRPGGRRRIKTSGKTAPTQTAKMKRGTVSVRSTNCGMIAPTAMEHHRWIRPKVTCRPSDVRQRDAIGAMVSLSAPRRWRWACRLPSGGALRCTEA